MKKSVFVVVMFLAAIGHVDAMPDPLKFADCKKQDEERFMPSLVVACMNSGDRQNLDEICGQSTLFASHAGGANNPAYLAFGVNLPAHSYFSGPTGQPTGCEQQRECDSEQVGNEEPTDSSEQKFENKRGRRARKARWVEGNSMFPCYGFRIPTQNWIGRLP